MEKKNVVQNYDLMPQIDSPSNFAKISVGAVIREQNVRRQAKMAISLLKRSIVALL